ncbi:MAG: phosphohydrolase, partial [Bacteroidetes bacterium]|nr:phosphohydrolase [Bacteroidota bacterium]
NEELVSGSNALDFFLGISFDENIIEKKLATFCQLDDFDITYAIKNWASHPDKILSTLCRFIIDRQLLKAKLQPVPFSPAFIKELRNDARSRFDLTEEEAGYFVFTGQAMNTTYDPADERINILFKNGHVKDISQVDNALIHQTLSSPVKKFYICYLRE